MATVTKREQFPIQEVDEKKELLKNTIAKGLTDDEFELFCMVCKRTGLDPFMKQIYPVKRWDSKAGRETMTIQTSIDGFRAIAERTSQYSPGRESTYAYNGKELISATSYVKKMTPDGTWHEVAATAFFEEYCQKGKDGQPTQFWRKMPHVMLAKCAESHALRKAFPALFSKIYSEDEMDQASNPEETSEIVETHETIEVVDTLNEEQLAEVKKILNGNTKLYREVLAATGKKGIPEVKAKDFDLLIDLIHDTKARMEQNEKN